MRFKLFFLIAEMLFGLPVLCYCLWFAKSVFCPIKDHFFIGSLLYCSLKREESVLLGSSIYENISVLFLSPFLLEKKLLFVLSTV